MSGKDAHVDVSDMERLVLGEMRSICVTEDGVWHRPEYPRYEEQLAQPKPFLVPSFDNEIVEILPSEKQNRKIVFDEEVHVMEIENRFQMMEPEDIQDDDSYEIEIVEGSGAAGDNDDDADFYLEMIDGEIFYVFETEDDISVEDEYDSDEDSSDSETNTPGTDTPMAPLQLNIGDMMAPNLGESFAQLDTSDLLESNGDDSGENFVLELESDCKTEEDNDAAGVSPALELSPKTDKSSIPMVVDMCAHTDDSADLSVPTSPLAPRQSVPIGIHSPPISPERSVSGLVSPSTPRSILKASPRSPIKSKKEKKEKKIKKEKKEKKTFSKTFVRAADFDGEHRVYSWEKPTWTNKELKSTGKGDDIRNGASLANPITDAAKLIEKGTVKWEKPEWATGDTEQDDVDAKEELIRKIQDGSMNLPGLQKNKRRLKLSINGSILESGGDIVKPITSATIIKKPSNINFVANPKILRATPVGSKLWKGENLAGPVTQATTVKKYQWEKPAWVKNSKLQTSHVGEKLKAGEDILAAPISKGQPDWVSKRGIGRASSSSDAEVKKEYTWEKPSWAKARLQSNGEETGLKSSDKGKAARMGNSLAKPITQLPHMNRGANNSIDESDRTGDRHRSLRRTKSDDQ